MLRSKPIVPGGRSRIAIVNKYNVWKVLSFIVTDNAWITQEGLTYLSNYPEQFSNFVFRPVAHNLVMYKL